MQQLAFLKVAEFRWLRRDELLYLPHEIHRSCSFPRRRALNSVRIGCSHAPVAVVTTRCRRQCDFKYGISITPVNRGRIAAAAVRITLSMLSLSTGYTFVHAQICPSKSAPHRRASWLLTMVSGNPWPTQVHIPNGIWIRSVFLQGCVQAVCHTHFV